MSPGPGDIHTLTNARGSLARIATFGATLMELRVPDRDGRLGNVVLGLDDVAAYAAQNFFLGATCGRVGNRIRNARFALDGNSYHLEANDPPHHLHGGSRGWYRAVWTAEPVTSADGEAVALTHVSPDGDAGYPGTVEARVIYTLTKYDALRVEMSATTDRPTPINLVHHSYFNLAGAGTILDHALTIFGDAYTPGDPIVPTGAIEPVAGTPFDFGSPKRVLPDLDHNFVVRPATPGQMRAVARLADPRSGRTMTVVSDQPGLQVYAGKFLDGSTAGRGVVHARNSGICLETQAFPNAINLPDWRDQVVLRPGETYRHSTIYTFTVGT
jgi:aldose 1-epimerase